MIVKGSVFKYGDNVDTDVIIPARYLNIADPAELATHAMEDIDTEFVKKLCDRRDLCKDFLPQCHQHRPSHSGMRSRCKRY